MIIFLILLTAFTIGKSDVASPKCPPNMIQYYKDHTICYFFVANATSFDDAEKFCNQNNGSLAPVLDIFANFFISQNAYEAFNNSQDFWIGGKSVNVNDATIWLWTWHNSFPFYFDWDHGEPSKNGCMASTTATASWSSQDCNASKPFVCQIPAIIELCDPEWTYFKASNQDGMCYRYMSQPNITFAEAQSVCVSQNANLVSIHGPEENSFLSRIALYGTSELWNVQGVFIGLHYINSAWKWLDGSNVNYENWGPNRPYNMINWTVAHFYAEQAAYESENWDQKWDNNVPAFFLNRFICKKTPNFAFIAENL